MLRTLAALTAASWMLLAAAPRPAAAQRWNDARTDSLVRLATARRAEQLADTGLVSYHTTAHGYVTFLAQMGEGFREPPKIVKADELALEVYWKAPNLSKQYIQGRRDTLLLPTDISYHRDHLGIVQNNFPQTIRLGEGDEVRDVPHPLSAAGLQAYDFAIADSLRIRLPDRTIEVYEVRVRPRDDTRPGVVGAVYIERGTGQVVRMAFSFTRAAFLDRQLEDISIVLENSLVEGRFWLPSRQEIEIRRAGTWLDFPVRGIIRGRWEIGSYDINPEIPPGIFAGPEIVQLPPSIVRSHQWSGRILDSLPPDVRAVTDADVKRVQEEARSLVRAQALARARTPSLFARAVSDFVRVNRVEGLALGVGITKPFGAGVSVTPQVRYGLDDERVKYGVDLAWKRPSGAGVTLFYRDDYREAGDVQETSRIRNTIAAQEFGSDYTDPYAATSAGLALDFGTHLGLHWRAEGAYQRDSALAVRSTPASGRYEPTIPALPIEGPRVSLVLDRPTMLAPLGFELQMRAELRGRLLQQRWAAPGDPRPRVLRGALSLDLERPVGARQRLVLRSTVAALSATPVVPPQELVFLGGPTTAPGYDFHELAGKVGASQRVEWRLPVPFVPLSLGRFGRAPGQATLAPYVNAAYVRHPVAGVRSGREGLYPSAGVGLLTLFDLLRFDVARGLRDGRWSFAVDVERALWGVL